MKRVLGVLNGRDFPAESLQMWAQSAEWVLAADGAAQRLNPDLGNLTIIGDLDSLGSYQGLAKVIHDPDQDLTDADKLLAHATSGQAHAITLISVEGDRLDHLLATLNSCARSSLSVRLILRRGIGYIARAGDSLQLSAHTGQRCSFIPLAESTVDWHGVAWPLQEAQLSPVGRVSISNRASDPIVSLHLQTGIGLLIMETEKPPSPEWGKG